MTEVEGFLLRRLEKGQDAFSKEQLPDWLRRELPRFLTRDDDAALFADLLSEQAGKAATSDETRCGQVRSHPNWRSIEPA